MNCLIIDDDPLICDLIKHFCSKQDWIQSCLAVSNGSQAIQAINTTTFDFIFLDFNLPDLNGRHLLELLPVHIPVIMVTSEVNFGAESYSYQQVVDFLVKPVSYDRFMKALLKIKPLIEKEKQPLNRLIVKVGNDSVILTVADIRFMKSEGNYVRFYLHDQKVLGLITLRALEGILPPNFVRCHKSFIVNLNHLKAISTDELKFADDSVPIGAKYKDDLLSQLKTWNFNPS